MRSDPSFLQVVWFVLIGILWAGFFVLEGFDFGVGMLVRVLGRDNVDKRIIIHSIGPVWDGNEVWLLVAGGATFAAFPGWYSSAFSGLYLALFLVLACLIVRGVSFEFWGKSDSERWRSGWEWAMGVSSGVVALLFGVAWANFMHGVPMGSGHIVHASLWDLLHPYALLGGLTTLSLFFAHGSNVRALRVSGGLRDRAGRLAGRSAIAAAAITGAFMVWTIADQSGRTVVTLMAALTILVAALMPFLRSRSEGAGFLDSTLVILLLTAAYFATLYPNALPSSTGAAYDLSLSQASSSHYTLVVMSIVALVFVPIVLLYQAWTYWVFRYRLGREEYEGPLTPLAVAEQKLGSAGEHAR